MRFIIAAYIVVAAFSMVSPAPARAVARAPFPDTHALQPPPKDVHADISHNISGTVGAAPDTGSDNETPAAGTDEQQNGSEIAPAPSSSAQGTPLSLVLVYGALLIIICVLIYKIFRATDET